jgi:hypothetical protein
MHVRMINGFVKKTRAAIAIVNSNCLVFWFLITIAAVNRIRIQISGRNRYNNIFNTTNMVAVKAAKVIKSGGLVGVLIVLIRLIS